MRILFMAGAAAAVLITTPATAKELHCNVRKDIVDQIDGKELKLINEKYNIKVKDTYTKKKDRVTSNDYNKFVNIKFGEELSKDYWTNVQIRPRTSGECLNRITGSDRRYGDVDMWSGAYCDTRQHKRAGKLGMEPTATPDRLWVAVGKAFTTTKISHYASFWDDTHDGFVLVGVCVENK